MGLATGLTRGRYRARLAESDADLDAARALRWRAFRAGGAGHAAGRDGDEFDSRCRHVLIEDGLVARGQTAPGRLVCTFRMMPLRDGGEIGRSYAARHYGLAALGRFPAPMLEIGRFCIDPDCHDADVLRVAWAAITRIVDAEGVQMLFGCSSFAGTDAEAYLDAFAMLGAHHLAPKRWLPGVKAPRIFRFARRPGTREPDRRLALLRMPPLLRTYLAMGGWVSDHAVVDADLGTLHVFTGVEIARIPPARARALRQIAG
ncbi:GNAT family N-acetyltransferase [Albidovulum sp.]|uniref:GNAT family N-acetyltransferase n=1 Tax=Albidovulum sp. TaxID=1872424 RepID=UPI0035287699